MIDVVAYFLAVDVVLGERDFHSTVSRQLFQKISPLLILIHQLQHRIPVSDAVDFIIAVFDTMRISFNKKAIELTGILFM